MREEKEMKTHLILLCALVLACLSLPVWAEQPPAPSGDPFMGEYEGVYRWTGHPDLAVKGRVVTEGPGLYRAIVIGGDDCSFTLHGQLEGPIVSFMGFVNTFMWMGKVSADVLTIAREDADYGGVVEMKKMDRHSPTEAQAPPQGAVVLLPYAPDKAPDMSAWSNNRWKAFEDGSMGVNPGTGDNTTKAKIGDCQLHLEFYLPHMPEASGQGRANSGVYVENRYEIQVLDSFGVLPQSSGDCGSFYKISTASPNACFPPEHWQTYDITFHAARLNKDGTQREPAHITVVHNGTVIQDNVSLPEPTAGGTEGPGAAEDVLRLQDHGNRVRYRNIWYTPIKE
jgi:hypothetical protein